MTRYIIRRRTSSLSVSDSVTWSWDYLGVTLFFTNNGVIICLHSDFTRWQNPLISDWVPRPEFRRKEQLYKQKPWGKGTSERQKFPMRSQTLVNLGKFTAVLPCACETESGLWRLATLESSKVSEKPLHEVFIQCLRVTVTRITTSLLRGSVCIMLTALWLGAMHILSYQSLWLSSNLNINTLAKGMWA